MLSENALKEIDRQIAKYPANQKQSAVMAALAIAQKEYGWLTSDVKKFIANYLSMPAIAVEEVASFYTMYNTKPVGRYKITLCTNLPCQLKGANEAAACLKQKLKIDFNETTADGLFTLREGECMGACGDSPVLIVNDRQMHGMMDQEKIEVLLAELAK